MGKKHFTEEQIAFALRQAESGSSVAATLFSRSDFVQLSRIVAARSAIAAGVGSGWVFA